MSDETCDRLITELLTWPAEEAVGGLSFITFATNRIHEAYDAGARSKQDRVDEVERQLIANESYAKALAEIATNGQQRAESAEQRVRELEGQLNNWVTTYGKRGSELVNDGWQLAHDPATCGHPRACWLDRNYPESEKNYDPETRSGNPPIDTRCIMCEAEQRITSLSEENRMLREALLKYGDHRSGCARAVNGITECNCGYADALKPSGAMTDGGREGQ